MVRDDRTALFSDVAQIIPKLRESGEPVASEALADGSNTRTIRVRDGVPAVTGGPFAEANEEMAGYITEQRYLQARAARLTPHDR